MSYEKAMKRNNRRNKAHQPLGIDVLGANKRRAYPWLGSSWYEEGMDEKRAEYVRKWEEETERLLKENPNLEIVQ